MTEQADIADESSEEWKPVVGWEGFYEVSNLGGVRSLPRVVQLSNRVCRYKAHPTKQRVDAEGYLAVTLNRASWSGSKRVHALVAVAFLGPPEPGQEVCHQDGNRTNPRLSNLRWGTRTDNMQDCKQHGRTIAGVKHHNAKLTEEQVLAIRASSEATVVVAFNYDVTPRTIRDIRSGRRWSHIPFHPPTE